jgi:hypothetical protein
MKSKVLLLAKVSFSIQNKPLIALDVEDSRSRIILVEFNFFRL